MSSEGARRPFYLPSLLCDVPTDAVCSFPLAYSTHCTRSRDLQGALQPVSSERYEEGAAGAARGPRDRHHPHGEGVCPCQGASRCEYPFYLLYYVYVWIMCSRLLFVFFGWLGYVPPNLCGRNPAQVVFRHGKDGDRAWKAVCSGGSVRTAYRSALSAATLPTTPIWS